MQVCMQTDTDVHNDTTHTQTYTLIRYNPIRILNVYLIYVQYIQLNLLLATK